MRKKLLERISIEKISGKGKIESDFTFKCWLLLLVF